MSKLPSIRHPSDPELQPFLDGVRDLIREQQLLNPRLFDEMRTIEFAKKCNILIKHVDNLAIELNELKLINKSILEHATNIENELELQNRIMNDDLSMARNIQSALLPDIQSTIGEFFEVAIYHKQMEKVGGDFYDFFIFPNGKTAIGVHDVSGHRVSSALITAFLKAQYKHAAILYSSASEIVNWVSKSTNAFLRSIRHYSTVNFVVFGQESCRYVTGGGYGVVVRSGEAQLFKRTKNLIGLTVLPYDEFEMAFNGQDVLAIYTDGMFSAEGKNGTFYTPHRLNELLISHWQKPVQVILDLCVKDYSDFRCSDNDDITLIILRRRT